MPGKKGSRQLGEKKAGSSLVEKPPKITYWMVKRASKVLRESGKLWDENWDHSLFVREMLEAALAFPKGARGGSRANRGGVRTATKEPIYRDSELITSEMEYAGVLELRAGLDPDCPLNELARDVFAEMLNAAPESSVLSRIRSASAR